MRNAMLVLPATLVAPLHVGDHCSSSPRCWTMSLAVGKGSRSLVVGKHGADDVPWAWKNGCRGSAVGLGWDPLRAPNRCLPRKAVPKPVGLSQTASSVATSSTNAQWRRAASPEAAHEVPHLSRGEYWC